MRAEGINKQVLPVILIHHLLVYNFVNQVRHLSNLNSESDEFYTSFVKEMAALVDITSYGFGIIRSNTQEKRRQSHSTGFAPLPSVIYLDKGSEINFTVSIAVQSTNNKEHTDYNDMENMRLSLELSVNGVVEINVKKTFNYLRQLLLYEVMNVYYTGYMTEYLVFYCLNERK
ncbi:hypothetical protein EB796_018408 [Bugula neritina]|uniref:CATSPERG Ig-like domain-containing protein n=1 Tax=Bugula neritina TaxID=10212 RepID=A0A7J7JCA6_BUGNE|nr:hypothetical protein EB796_018408 [Bugula neritina]